MTNTSTHEFVAAEVRAQLARRRVSSRRICLLLGCTPPYLSRRLTGQIPFNVSDLAAIAELLDLPVGAFFQVAAGGLVTEYKTPPALRLAA